GVMPNTTAHDPANQSAVLRINTMGLAYGNRGTGTTYEAEFCDFLDPTRAKLNKRTKCLLVHLWLTHHRDPAPGGAVAPNGWPLVLRNENQRLHNRLTMPLPHDSFGCCLPGHACRSAISKDRPPTGRQRQ